MGGGCSQARIGRGTFEGSALTGRHTEGPHGDRDARRWTPRLGGGWVRDSARSPTCVRAGGGQQGVPGVSLAAKFLNQQRASGSSLHGLEARRTPDLRAQWFEVGVLMRGAPGGRLRGRGGARTPGN